MPVASPQSPATSREEVALLRQLVAQQQQQLAQQAERERQREAENRAMKAKLQKLERHLPSEPDTDVAGSHQLQLQMSSRLAENQAAAQYSSPKAQQHQLLVQEEKTHLLAQEVQAVKEEYQAIRDELSVHSQYSESRTANARQKGLALYYRREQRATQTSQRGKWIDKTQRDNDAEAMRADLLEGREDATDSDAFRLR